MNRAPCCRATVVASCRDESCPSLRRRRRRHRRPLFPAEALARELTARGWRIVLATDRRGEQYAHSFPAEERIALDAATGSRPDRHG